MLGFGVMAKVTKILGFVIREEIKDDIKEILSESLKEM